MDIHRCRFVHYPPSTINALAFSHAHIPHKQKQSVPVKLAIGRANGDIEIWNPLNGQWLQELVIRGGEDRSVDGLAWTQDPEEEDQNGKVVPGKLRLFSIGYTTTISEWDLVTGLPLRQSSGNHGEIWCIAAQPHVAPEKDGKKAPSTWTGQNLVVGCTDGALVMYSTEDDDLKLQRVLVRPSSKKAKIISVTFKDRNIIVAGCTDSTIRVYDARNGTSIRAISLGGGPAGGPKEIIVWAVKVLPSGNIVSGDSTGELRIWDGRTYTQVQRLKSHKQDILCLATSFDGSTIMSGGMDRRTVVYKQNGGVRSRWAEITHKRFHDHDVKTMASFEGKGMSFVVSGGPDAAPVVLPLREFGQEHQRTLPYLPQEPIVQSAPSQRLVMSWWDREISIWKLNEFSEQALATNDDLEDTTTQRKLVLKILLKGEANITSASLSSNGQLLAVATNTHIKLFQLRRKTVDGNEVLRATKIELPSSKTFKEGARIVQFSPNGCWLAIIRNNSAVHLARVIPGQKDVKVLSKAPQVERRRVDSNKLGVLATRSDYERTINRVAFSADSTIFAVSDLEGYIDNWKLMGEEQNTDEVEDVEEEDSDSDDSDNEETESKPLMGQFWTRVTAGGFIPKLPSPAVVLSFRPHAASGREIEDRLLVVTASSQVFEFDVLKGTLSAWSRNNPTETFPEEFRNVRDQVMGCLWDMSQSRERLWLYGNKWVFMFDLSRDFPRNEEMKQTRKRKHSGLDDLRRNTTGAGSKIAEGELETGMSRKFQKISHEEEGAQQSQDVVLSGRRKADAAADADAADDDAMDMVLDRGVAASKQGTSTDVTVTGTEGKKQAPHWWCTYKYRPIMGIVCVGGGVAGSDKPLEVALVERPEWELDLPPRYYGDQEWEKAGL